MRWLTGLVWPHTYGRRFWLATAICQPVLLLVAVMLGWAQQLPLAVTMADIWAIVAVVGLGFAIVLAAACTPGISVWKPLWAVSADEELMERQPLH